MLVIDVPAPSRTEDRYEFRCRIRMRRTPVQRLLRRRPPRQRLRRHSVPGTVRFGFTTTGPAIDHHPIWDSFYPLFYLTRNGGPLFDTGHREATIRFEYPVSATVRDFFVHRAREMGTELSVTAATTHATFDDRGSDRHVLAFGGGKDSRMLLGALRELGLDPLIVTTGAENVPDLPEELWEGDEITRQITWAGEQLGKLNLLPAPWPIQDLLSERDLKHVMRLFGIGGLSYGNLSARRDEHTFWMSASGVDKSKLYEVGRDILLVKDYVPERNAMILSVSPKVQPRRVSVDAIEHFMIYREHPDVGAIVHIHAWMDDINSTEINYPCGTRELAVAVSDLVRDSPDPSRAVVGLKNHGLTITGRSLPDIFERIDGRILAQVPMS